MQTRKQAAAEHGVSVPTIDRWEADLRARGKLERHTSKDRRHSWIVIFGAIKNDLAAAAAAAAGPAPEVLSEPPRIMDAPTRDKKHTPPVAPPVPRPTLAAAVREAFDAYHGARASLKRVEQYLESNYPDAGWAPDARRYWYNRERDDRQRRRAFQRQVDELPTLPQRKLIQRDKWCHRLLEADPNGPDGAKYRLACALQPYIAAELERRAPVLARVKSHRRRGKNEDSALADNQQSVNIGSAPTPEQPTQPGFADLFPEDQRALDQAPTTSPSPIPAACVPSSAAGDTGQPDYAALRPGLADRLRQRTQATGATL